MKRSVMTNVARTCAVICMVVGTVAFSVGIAGLILSVKHWVMW